MAIVLVQQAAANSGNVNFPGNVTAGNFLACVIAHRDGIGVISPGPTSTHGTWVLVAASPHPTDNLTVELWMVPTAASSSTQVQMPGLNKRRAFIMEYSGVGKTQFDKAAVSTGTGTIPATGTTAVTTKANELWLGALVASIGSGTYSLPTGGVIIDQGFSGGGGAEQTSAVLQLIAGATGPASMSATFNSSETWAGAIGTFYGADAELINATIPAVSTVTASMLAIDIMTATTIAVTAVTATLERLRRITATVPAVSTMTAAMIRQRKLVGTIQGFSDVVADGDVVSSELVITSVDFTEVAAQGGEEVTLIGTFPVGQPVQVFVGPTGTIQDPQAYSGISGQGNNYIPRRPDRLRIFLPRLPVGVHRIHAESPGGSFTLLNALTVRPKQFRSNVFGLRKILPPRWSVGSRHLEDES